MTCNVSSEVLWISRTEVSGRCEVAGTLENQVVLKDFTFFPGQSLWFFAQICTACLPNELHAYGLTNTAGLLVLIPHLRIWLAQGRGLSIVSFLCHDKTKPPLSLSDL